MYFALVHISILARLSCDLLNLVRCVSTIVVSCLELLNLDCVHVAALFVYFSILLVLRVGGLDLFCLWRASVVLSWFVSSDVRGVVLVC